MSDKMNDKVLNNVPRELLERVLGEDPMDAWDARKELRALLTAQPQAGAAQSAPAGEREAFEAAYQVENAGFMGPLKLERDERGQYKNQYAETCWRLGQQAGAAWLRTQSAPAVPVVPEGLNKTREQWQKVDAKQCANSNSSAANFYLIRDAQQDIERLHRALAASPAQPAVQDWSDER
ncbi:hypothetical protein MAJJADAN_00002 [Pseudomonas phage Amjad_SA]|nr:hypothetical protein MAJJADAN_00002 [Pseudomonas phage Amjad_SA]